VTAVSTRRKLVTATGGMAVVTLLSRFTGLVRDKTATALLGAGMVTDAFYTAFRIPNMFRQFLAEGALHAAFIPTLAELKASGDRERTQAFVRGMTTVLLVALPVLVALGVLTAPALATVFAARFAENPEKMALTITLTRIMFPYLGLISLAALAQGVLNASGRFLLPAATPIALNLLMAAGTVATVWVFHGQAIWMAVGVLAGGLVQFTMQWAACAREGLPLLPGRGAFSNRDVLRVLAKMAPTITTLGIYPLTVLLSTRFASEVGEGAVTCMFNASRLNEMMYGMVIVQLTTAVLPMLAAEKLQSEQSARDSLGFAVRLLSVVSLPSTALSIALATAMTGALLGGGRYGLAAVHTTSSALVVYSLGMPFLALTKLLASASFAWNDTRSPVIASIVNLVVFFSLGIALTAPFGVRGVAAATSAGQVANALTLLWLDGRHGRLPRVGDVLPAIARHAGAALASGLVVVALEYFRPVPLATSVRSLALLGGYGVIGAAVYLGALVALRAQEWGELRRLVTRRKRS
jgi:putative peptidoglycan lipid II flippase